MEGLRNSSFSAIRKAPGANSHTYFWKFYEEVCKKSAFVPHCHHQDIGGGRKDMYYR